MKYSLKLRKSEIIVIVSILIVSALSYFLIDFTSGKSPDDTVEVRQNGNVIFNLTKDQINQDGLYEFQFDKGIATLEVKDKKIRMLPMDRSICPQAVCSDTGWIESKPRSIVCLPNSLIVDFVGGQESDVDIII